jgi:hypothetical protein
MMPGARQALAAELEKTIRPLIDLRPDQDGYNCCGCSTYDAILDHAIRIVLGEQFDGEER